MDIDRQTVGGTWSDGNRGGIAVLVVASGRIDREWVLPGTRAITYQSAARPAALGVS